MLVQISNPDATPKQFLTSKRNILRIVQPWQRYALSECFLDEHILKSEMAVCHHRSKFQSNQSLLTFIFILVLSPFNISNKRVFKNKWCTADFRPRGLCKKRVSLEPPSCKTKQDTSAKRKGKCALFSVCGGGGVEENIRRKFPLEEDDRKLLNLQVTVARSCDNGQAWSLCPITPFL